jgi:chemotaxis protein methyltransferase CheR
MHRGTFDILIAEGVDGRHAEIEEHLRSEGYRVERLASCSVHPITQHARNPQLILLDLSVLGGSSPPEQLRILSRLTVQSQIPVIILAPDTSLEFELLDVYDFLSDPIDLYRLQTDIERLIVSPPLQPEVIAPNDTELELFQSFIGAHTGLHFSHRNNRILEQGLHQRMCAVGVASYTAYHDYLLRYSESRNELKKLLSLLTIGETSFFRYSNHRDAFVNQLIPDIIERRRHTKIVRIWSAGCSTGEEPYGIAMLLAENFPELEGWTVEILATDINKRSLRAAREGIYGKRAVRLVEENDLKKYFTQVGGLHLVSSELKNCVRFDYLNLKDEKFPSLHNNTIGFDIIFCRNVMIYFETETTRQIVGKFADCLTPGGFLLLGHSETLQNVTDRFERRQWERAFYYQLPPDKKPALELRPSGSTAAAAPSARDNRPVVKGGCREPEHKKVARQASPPLKAEKKTLTEDLFETARMNFNREEFLAAEEGYAAVLALEPDHLGALIGNGLSTANRGDYDTARKFCARAEKVDDLCPDIYFLRGMICDMESRPAEAVVEYQKVLWLDPCFIVAHYALSRLHRQTSDLSTSRRALQNAVRCLEKTAPSTRIHLSGGMTREVFLELCRNDLDTFAD